MYAPERALFVVHFPGIKKIEKNKKILDITMTLRYNAVCV